MKTSISRLLLALSLLSTIPAHAGLVSGPMLGPVTMREAQIWIQAEQPAAVRIAYEEVGAISGTRWSTPVETDSANGHTASLRLSGVEPGKTYNYRVELDGSLVTEPRRFSTPAFYHDRTPPPDFTIAVGGAHYRTQTGYEPPYRILGAGYDIFSTILETRPALMLWLGNTAHLRESDWTSKSGYLKRFAHTRSTPEMQALLSTVPQYATWGEADYGPPFAGSKYSYQADAEAAFRAFWPPAVEVTQLKGIATRFRYADVDFFLLDTRSYRNDRPSGQQIPQVLGADQIEWLRQELIHSRATFKVIAAGAPILNPAKSRSNLSYAEREHQNLLQMLRDERISGLFFLSGGKYYGELTRLVHANSYNLYDLTLGPLTANPRQNNEELNFFRMPGTSTFERHFALIDFSGPEEDRRITIRVMSMEGSELWSRDIAASQLQPVGD